MDYLFEAHRARKFLSEGKRVSNRGLFDLRQATINVGVIEKAEGSAIVDLGDTKVIAGVKILVDKPFSDNPNEGSISINVEMSAMADPNYEAGPPSTDSIELSRVVDRSVRESRAIDFESLLITPSERAYFIYVDLYILNNGGNLFDACNLAVISAINNAYLPKLDENFNILEGEKDKALKLNFNPILFTFVKIGDKIILDPDIYEDAAAESRFSISINPSGDVHAIQKGKGGSFTFEELSEMYSVAKQKYKERDELLKGV